MDERREFCESHKEKTDKLWTTLFGNGRQGLISDVVSIKVTNKIILSINLLMLGAIIKIIFFK